MNCGSKSCHCFDDPKDGKIFDTRDVAAEIERIFALAQLRERHLPGLACLIFARVDQFKAKESRCVIARDAHIFFQEGFFISRAGADIIEVLGFIKSHSLIIGGQFQLQLVQEPFFESGLEGDSMERKLFRVSFVPCLKDQLIEIIRRAAGGRKNLQLSAPGDAGLCDRVKFAGVGMEREFIEDPIAALASLRVDITRHGMDTKPVGETERECRVTLVIDAKGEPINGTDVRIESRDGKEVFSTVKTDSRGRYISPRLLPGVYRVTLLVTGEVKASIKNTQTTANQPTQLNFELKPTAQTGNITKGGKHMVWVPNRTGSHLGGNWVEVDDKGNEHSDSNMQTYTTRRW
jgi:hypothetical protein